MKVGGVLFGRNVMMRGKRLCFLLVVITSLMMLIACSAEKRASSNEQLEQQPSFTKLVVGTQASYEPLEYVNESGNIVGIEMEILQAISEEMGVEFDIRNIGWEPVFQQVASGEIDVGVSAITITDERKKKYDFTEPYYEVTQLMIVREESNVQYLKDLKNKKIAVQQSTTGLQTAQLLQGEHSTNIVAYESLPLAIEQVANGNVDGAIGDNVVISEYIKNNREQQLESVEDASFHKEHFGFMVKKGNHEVVQFLNEGIQKIKRNGTLERITGQHIE